MNSLFLTGQDQDSIIFVEQFACELHKDIVAPLNRLQKMAKATGQDLMVASGYRSFDRQLQIWNEKAAGTRPVLDEKGLAIDFESLSDWEKVQAILTWSALPGASRHHWGTDVDVFNPKGLPRGYCLQLTEEEYSNGPMQEFSRWLDAALEAPEQKFFRPYNQFCGGIRPEPWHISYRPLADQYQAALSADLLSAVLESVDMSLKPAVLAHLDEIVDRYVQVSSSAG